MGLKIYFLLLIFYYKYFLSFVIFFEGRNKEKDDLKCNLYVLILIGNINCVIS